METAVILNIVLLSIIGVAVVLYFVWLGLGLSKVKVNMKDEKSNFESTIEDVYNSLEVGHNELDKRIQELENNFNKDMDKLDSRIDIKIKNTNSDIEDLSKSVTCRIDDIWNSIGKLEK